MIELCSIGHVKLDFTTLPRTLLPNCFNFSAQSSHMIKKQFSSKKNSSKFLWTSRKHIWHSWGNYLWEIRNHFGSFSRKNFRDFGRMNFSAKDYFWRKEKLLKSLRKKTHKKLNFYRSFKEKEIVENKFFKKNQIVFFGTETAVFTDVPKTSTKEPKLFLSVFQKVKNTFFAEKFTQMFF